MLLPQTSKSFILHRQNLLIRQAYFFINLLNNHINYINISKYYLELHLKHQNFCQIIQIIKLQWYLRYATVVDIAAVDYPTRKYRFSLTYIFNSYDITQKLLVSCNVHEKKPVTTLTNIYKGTAWQEREVWDFFGIFFSGNKDLRRILTDYGFVGHPLRKDFPLTGFYELGYDERKKQVTYRPVSLAQEFRNFRAVNPWSTLDVIKKPNLH